MMADEGASSSSNSIDDLDERQEAQSTPSFTPSFNPRSSNENCTTVSSSGHVASGNTGLSRLSYNPFAIKTATPVRSSTDNKEIRPLVAPPTLKLDGPCGTTSAPKIVLIPSSISSQAEKIKQMNKHDTCASSSSNSIDDLDEQELQPPSYTSSFSSRATNDNCTAVSSSGHIAYGNTGLSRLSCNPFAIKTATPPRSSTDNIETKPHVATPTVKLDGCGIAAAPKIVLRPSTLSAQAEKLKLMNKHDSNSKQEGKENSSDESNSVCKEAHSTIYESNGKISKAELFASGMAPSSEAAALSSPSKSGAIGESTFSLAGEKSPKGSFIFGQNLHERALNYEKGAEQPESPTDNLTFEEAALKKEEQEKLEKENQEAEKLQKSLSESAKEYESKQVKRKFDEVTVITGEEEESNVLQMNCKLFAFDKTNMNWLERGRGILRLNDRENKGHIHSRVVMRTQGSLRVVLNTKVWAGMTVEHPSQKTVRLSAFDPQGVKVFLVMAHPKDAEQLFSALDWRVTSLRRENSEFVEEGQSVVEEATSSSGLPDTSFGDEFGACSSSKRARTLDHDGCTVGSSSEANFLPSSSPLEDSFVDSSEAQCREFDPEDSSNSSAL